MHVTLQHLHILFLDMPKHAHISVLHMPKHVHIALVHMPKQLHQCTSTITHVPCHINTSLELLPNQITGLITHQANTMVLVKHFENQIGTLQGTSVNAGPH